jgi:hypothetical protein
MSQKKAFFTRGHVSEERILFLKPQTEIDAVESKQLLENW